MHDIIIVHALKYCISMVLGKNYDIANSSCQKHGINSKNTLNNMELSLNGLKKKHVITNTCSNFFLIVVQGKKLYYHKNMILSWCRHQKHDIIMILNVSGS